MIVLKSQADIVAAYERRDQIKAEVSKLYAELRPLERALLFAGRPSQPASRPRR
ncbi:MAG: hypothetical protein ABSA30_00135 [Candidatus Aminicenantales bacterium]|jgi:hypothetical protein